MPALTGQGCEFARDAEIALVVRKAQAAPSMWGKLCPSLPKPLTLTPISKLRHVMPTT